MVIVTSHGPPASGVSDDELPRAFRKFRGLLVAGKQLEEELVGLSSGEPVGPRRIEADEAVVVVLNAAVGGRAVGASLLAKGLRAECF